VGRRLPDQPIIPWLAGFVVATIARERLELRASPWWAGAA